MGGLVRLAILFLPVASLAAVSWFFVPLSGTSFLPSDVSNLQLWLDANDIDGAGDGPTGDGLSDTDPVTTWDDKSANDYDGDGTGHAPAYRTGIQNSKPAIQFDDTSACEYIRVPDANELECTSGCDLFFVAQFADLAEAKAPIVKDSTSSKAWAFIMFSAGFNDPTFAIWGDHSNAASWHGRQDANAISASTTYLFNFHYAGGTAGPDDIDIGLNGSDDTDDTTANTGSAFPPGDNATADVQIGGRPDLSGFEWCLDGGYIMEVLFYDTEVSSGDRSSIKTYLNGKWAIY